MPSLARAGRVRLGVSLRATGRLELAVACQARGRWNGPGQERFEATGALQKDTKSVSAGDAKMQII